MHDEYLSERQNADRVFGRAEGDPQWVPLVGIYNDLVYPDALHERPSGPVGEDWAGCRWIFNEKCLGYAPDVKQPPVLSNICDWREVVKFPDLDAIDWEVYAEKELAEHDHESKYLCMFMATGPWERVQALMGLEEAFVSIYEEPEELKALLNAITDYKINVIKKLGQYYHPDQFFFQDDLGTANGPMFSVDTYREFLKPCHTRIAQAIHELGAIYIHHSCGWMDALIPDLIEAGVDSFNPLQSMNDWKGIVEKYGEITHFDVGVGSTDLSTNTNEIVKNNVHEIIDTFAPTKHLSVMCFPTNAEALPLMDVAQKEIIDYGHRIYA